MTILKISLLCVQRIHVEQKMKFKNICVPFVVFISVYRATDLANLPVLHIDICGVEIGAFVTENAEKIKKLLLE